MRRRISRTLSVDRTFCTGRPHGDDDVVDVDRLVVDRREHGFFRLVELQLGRMADRLTVAVAGKRRGRGQRAQLLQHVIDRFDQLRAVANQAVAAARRAAIDAAGHGKHLAALLHGVPGGNQRAGALGGFDDDHAQAQAGDDPVPLRKRARQAAASGAGFR